MPGIKQRKPRKGGNSSLRRYQRRFDPLIRQTTTTANKPAPTADVEQNPLPQSAPVRTKPVRQSSQREFVSNPPPPPMVLHDDGHTPVCTHTPRPPSPDRDKAIDHPPPPPRAGTVKCHTHRTVAPPLSPEKRSAASKQSIHPPRSILPTYLSHKADQRTPRLHKHFDRSRC